MALRYQLEITKELRKFGILNEMPKSLICMGIMLEFVLFHGLETCLLADLETERLIYMILEWAREISSQFIKDIHNKYVGLNGLLMDNL